PPLSLHDALPICPKPSASMYERAMAMALTAWLTAWGPMAWTSTSPALRSNAAIAPATELGRDDPETRKISMTRPPRRNAGVPIVVRPRPTPWLVRHVPPPRGRRRLARLTPPPSARIVTPNDPTRPARQPRPSHHP